MSQHCECVTDAGGLNPVQVKVSGITDADNRYSSAVAWQRPQKITLSIQERLGKRGLRHELSGDGGDSFAETVGLLRLLTYGATRDYL